MAGVKLGFFIPSYNRDKFLEYVLSKFHLEWEFPFDIELYISDNASMDNTRDVISKYIDLGLPIKYYRHETTVPVAHNFEWARRRCSGEYVMYLADDDLIIPDEVVKNIRFLDRNKYIVASFSPTEDFDDIEGVALGQSYTLEDSVIAKKSSFLPFFEHMLRQGIRPEAGIWRASAISHLGVLRSFSFVPYADMADLLLLGDVLFTKAPFYRLVVRSKLAAKLHHAGVEVGKFGWDQERGGFEELFTVIGDRAGLHLDPASLQRLSQMLDLATAVRQASALGLWCDLNEYVRAYELYNRIRLTLRRWSVDEVGFPGLDAAKTYMKGRVPMRVIVEAARLNRTRKILLVGSCQRWAEVLRAVGLPDDVAVGGAMTWDELGEPEYDTLIVAENAAQQALVMEQGYPKGMVFNMEMLAERYRIP